LCYYFIVLKKIKKVKMYSPENNIERFPSAVAPQPLETQAEQYLPDVMAQVEVAGVHNPEVDHATPEQVDNIISSAHDMVNALPTERHTEQEGVTGKVDVEEALLPGVNVRHVTGQEGDVTVIEPYSEDGNATIVIDNKSGGISIDGAPVDKSGADKVAGVIATVRNMNAGEAPNNDAIALDEQAEITDSTTTERPQKESNATSSKETEINNIEDEKAKDRKRQVLGPVNQLIKTPNGNKVFEQLASEMGVEAQELQDRMRLGDINITPDTMRALNELNRDAAKLDSDIWRTDPRTPSLLGGSARESQQYLAGLLKNMF
jgi:hypothetical protein